MMQTKRQGPLLTVVLTIILTSFLSTGLASAQSGSSGSTAGANPHAISLYNLGLNAYKQGSPESAIIFFKRAVDLDPDLADAQYNLGVLYQSEKRLKEAVPRFKEALRVRPDDADSHYQLALTLLDMNELSGAREQFMAIAPNNSHFSDAQRHVAAIDAQMANPNATAVSSARQSATPSQIIGSSVNPAIAATTPVQTITPTNVVNSTPAVNINTGSIATATSQPGNSAPVAAAAPATGSNPVALIDNASVQVVANGFSAPSGLTFDKQGNLYVANFVTNTIDRLAPDGKKTQFSAGVNLKGPIGLISDDDSNIYVANYLAGTITRINPAGIAQIIVSGLRKPYYLASDKEGNIFVSQQEDNTIVRISFSHGLGAVYSANPANP